MTMDIRKFDTNGIFVILLTAVLTLAEETPQLSTCQKSEYCGDNGQCYNTPGKYAVPDASVHCHLQWPVYSRNSCFRVHWHKMTWDEAQEYCNEQTNFNSQLASNQSNQLPDPIQLERLMQYFYVPQNVTPYLWLNACNSEFGRCYALLPPHYNELREMKKTEKALPLCRMNSLLLPMETNQTVQCRCKSNQTGPSCDSQQSGIDLGEAAICPSREFNKTFQISCPKKRIYIDFASYGRLPNDTSTCTNRTNVTDEPCNYAASTRAILKKMCDGKESCSEDEFEQVFKYRESYLGSPCNDSSEPVLKVRFRCVRENDMVCTSDLSELNTKTACLRYLPVGNYTWFSALDTCRAIGGDLAFIPFKQAYRFRAYDGEQRSFIHTWIGNIGKDPLAITDSEYQEDECWYLNITSTHVSPIKEDNIVCTAKREYYPLCQITPNNDSNSRCPPNSTEHYLEPKILTCYLLVREKATRSEARAVCKRVGGDLATYYPDKRDHREKLISYTSDEPLGTHERDMDKIFWVAGPGVNHRDYRNEYVPCAKAKKAFQIIRRTTCNFKETLSSGLCALPLEHVSTLTTPVPASEKPTTTKKPPTTPGNRKICKSVEYRYRNEKVQWPETKPDEFAVVSCSKNGDFKGNATWLCDGSSGTFVPPGKPDFSKCTSLPDLTDLLKDKSTSEGATKLLATLENSSLLGGDLNKVIDAVDSLMIRLDDQMNKTEKDKHLEVLGKVAGSMADVYDKLLDEEQMSAWDDLPTENQREISTNFLKSADGMGFGVARHTSTEPISVPKKKNFNLQIINSPKDDYMDKKLIFPADQSPSTIMMPPRFVEEPSLISNDRVKCVFTSYENLSALLPTENFKKANDNDNETIKYEINSVILGAQLNSTSYSMNFKNGNVTITFKHKYNSEGKAACAFWNTISQKWEEDGCTVESHNSTHTVCSCNHLTNFAVLMDLHGQLPDQVHQSALTWITIVGCSISIICLTVTVIIFFVFRSLWTLKNTMVHCNLCICLLIAQLVLLIGLDSTGNKLGCAIVAGLLHFFWLGAFMWMALEGIQLYVMLVKVFDTGDHKSWLYYSAGYGIPAMIVTISASARPGGYGTSKHCWLSVENGVIYSFAGPIAVIMIFNVVILTMALRAAASIKVQQVMTNVESAKLWIRRAMSLLPLLGLTWVFGFFYVDDEYSLVFAYLFAIFNSLQGVFVFIFHCLRNEKVQQVVGRYIRRRRDKFRSTSKFTGTKSRSESVTGMSSVGPRTVSTNDNTRRSSRSAATSNSAAISNSSAASNEPIYENVPSKRKKDSPKTNHNSSSQNGSRIPRQTGTTTYTKTIVTTVYSDPKEDRPHTNGVIQVSPESSPTSSKQGSANGSRSKMLTGKWKYKWDIASGKRISPVNDTHSAIVEDSPGESSGVKNPV